MSTNTERLRLISIKLAGFKSFVDPTTVPFPSQLCAVVGPNGCGKSNIIDAVRWVMGESSAKYLRGDNITDVIFNGSSARKPVGQASVELLFANPHGALGGEYAQFSEISIKRVVNRDGQSNYFLNNVRCRRRDILDVFLGTGLGPRSYSIIEQGMISRLIEAKPDELRANLEEAAEISKYKERRRETENRMRHTRENLERLNDIREELVKQLARLQRQSSAAERYKVLKDEERSLKGFLHALRWKQLDEQISSLEQSIRELDVELERFNAEQTDADKGIEVLRESHTDAVDACQETQEAYYRVGAEVSRIEQSLQHQKERRIQFQEDLQQLSVSLEQSQRHYDEDQQWLNSIEETLVELVPQSEEASAKAEQANETLAMAEESMQAWQEHSDEFNQQSAAAQQEAQVQQTRIQHLEQTIQQATQQTTKLHQERQVLDTSTLEAELTELNLKQSQSIERVDTVQNLMQQLRDYVVEYREKIEQTQQRLNQSRSQLQQQQGRHASLEALQQAALGNNNQKMTRWLQQNTLETKPRLAQELQIEKGWETALETVLGAHLQAVCVDNMEPLLPSLQSLEGDLMLMDATPVQSTASSRLSLPLLVSKITSSWPMQSLLDGVYSAEDLTQALQIRQQLATNESVVTKDGLWLSKHWLRVFKGHDERAGVLEREHALKDLAQSIEALQEGLQQDEASLREAKEALSQYESEQQLQQGMLNQISDEKAQLQAQIKIKESRIEAIQQRLQRMAQDEAELLKQITQAKDELTSARDGWQIAMTQMEEFSEQRETLLTQRENLQEQLQQARQWARDYREESHQLSLKLQTVKTEKQTKENNLSRLEQQIAHSRQRDEHLRLSLESCDEPLVQLQEDLESSLHRRLTAEEALAAARAKVDELDHQLREKESQRHRTEQQINRIREGGQQQRMQWQGAEVRRHTIQEQLQAEGQTVETWLEILPADSCEQHLSEQLEDVTQKIQRLGPINLAAIDEYQTEQERKDYLDKQYNDLTEALETLDGAIKKIDKETRQRFKETFDLVNEQFKLLFPKVFNGGSAYLELTSDDLLEAGIVVNARPPGKRNSTIHLLSGGEKALTAIALVFSIFQLNPAPFCMLDEVDAPLDDANVLRYCHLVKEMSNQVQFIFISHNKLAIEMAHHLAGVTMKEPGVSRMVAVDIEEAMAMAEV